MYGKAMYGKAMYGKAMYGKTMRWETAEWTQHRQADTAAGTESGQKGSSSWSISWLKVRRW